MDLTGSSVSYIHRQYKLNISTGRAANFQLSPLLTYMGIKQFNGLLLLKFRNVLGPNCLNSDTEMNLFAVEMHN